MKRILLITLAVTLWPAAGAVPQVGHSGPLRGDYARVAEAVSGVWDMNRRQRGLPVLLVIRQEGNLYPSFWGGRCEGGRFRVRAEEDFLTGELLCQADGVFRARLVHFPPKHGMEERIPGGVWSLAGKKQLDLYIEFRQFRNCRHVHDPRLRGQAYRLEADFDGVFHANGAETPVTGRAAFVHQKLLGTFDLTASATVNGSDLNLPAAQSGPLQVGLRLKSPVSVNLPSLDDNLKHDE
jgi:hypothetical protein